MHRLNGRVSKVEERLIPKELPEIRVVLRGPNAPEPEDEPGVQVIRVSLDAPEDSSTES